MPIAIFTVGLTPMMLFSMSTVTTASLAGPTTVWVRVSSGTGGGGEYGHLDPAPADRGRVGEQQVQADHRGLRDQQRSPGAGALAVDLDRLRACPGYAGSRSSAP